MYDDDGFSVAVSERRPGPTSNDPFGASAHELAQRRSGDVDVLLLWHPDLDRIELCVLDLATSVSAHVDVAPDKALDAFNHRYAYVTQYTPGRRPETDSGAARWE